MDTFEIIVSTVLGLAALFALFVVGHNLYVARYPYGRKKKCPHCGKRASVPICYGYPSPAAMDAMTRGELAMGGCVRSGDGSDKQYSCGSCHGSW